LKKKIIPANEKIRAKEVRVISAEGENFGVIPTSEALKIAKERGLDLVQVTDNVFPPVCKIIDHGKHLYKENKKKRKQSKTAKPQTKSIRLGFAISEHDMMVRVKSAEKFLSQGNSVRIVLPLKGRQKALEGVGREKINKFLEMVQEKTELKTEKQVSKEPRGLTVTIAPV
jgi:translation initiation factor IF-3